MNETKIRCNIIDYRKGYIEVTVGVHPNCVNIETWNTSPSIDINNLDIRDHEFPNGGVIANTEVELDIEAAKKLIDALNFAIQRIASSS